MDHLGILDILDTSIIYDDELIKQYVCSSEYFSALKADSIFLQFGTVRTDGATLTVGPAVFKYLSKS